MHYKQILFLLFKTTSNVVYKICIIFEYYKKTASYTYWYFLKIVYCLRAKSSGEKMQYSIKLNIIIYAFVNICVPIPIDYTGLHFAAISS